jgi:Holliday junction resolvase RusA-like endonuclease
MIDITLRCVPPSVTAQQKRVSVRRGKPVFFHDKRMVREASTWAALLAPHVPPAPMDGPLVLMIRLTYPHLKSTPKRDLEKWLPKVTKPDSGNAAKHLEDQLTRMRFVVDDAKFARTVIEKLHGPEWAVGIRIRIEPFNGSMCIASIS